MLRATCAALVMFAAGVPAFADGGRVNNLKVLSDQVDDVTTVENIVASFAKPAMSDQERSRALWRAVVKYRHQTVPPNEYLAADWEAHDPVKIFNVYGYCMCCCTSALIAALNRADGREARGRILNGHSVPEVRFGDGWHMYDASLITHFPRTDGADASVDEISAAVTDWLRGHPDYRKNGAKLVDFMRQDGWTGYKQGPALLAQCPYYHLGYFPARTHGWDATMVEYDRKSEVYEYGYQVGHRALFSLRPGESLVREAGNRGLHVNGDPGWDMLRARAPERDLAYVDDFVPGYRGGVVANGVHRYAPDLAKGELTLGAEQYENLASDAKGLYVKDPSRPGVAIVALSSPYVYLGGRVGYGVKSGGGRNESVTCAVSTNGGRTYEDATVGVSPSRDGTIAYDITRQLLRRYAVLLKLEIHADPANTLRLTRLLFEADFQHAPRTLPRLAEGRNTITVAADSDPTLATRTVACRIVPPGSSFAKNETTTTIGADFDNLRVEDGSCWWKGGVGTLTVPVEVPGDLAALRLSTQVRARGEKDRVEVQAGNDDGRTWRPIGEIDGPTPGTTRAFRDAKWPAGTRKVLVRFRLTGNNTVGIFNFRIDADYNDPLAARRPAPFHVVHRWTEAGRSRSHDEVIERLPKTYVIEAGAAPEMVSVSYEMP